MGTMLLAGPAVEPVTLEETKAHLRVEFTDDDALMAGLIKAARECTESATNRKLITQRWRVFEDKIPSPPEFALPFAPAQSVDWVRLWDSANNGSVLASTAYSTDTIGEPARVFLKDIPVVTLRQYNAVEIAFTCGYGATATTVPEPIKQAVKLLAAHWYENRIATAEASQQKFEELPLGVQYLLAPYRLWGRQL